MGNNSNNRDEKGRWVKGAPSPNPSGRPKTPDEIKEMFRLRTPEAVAAVFQILNSQKSTKMEKLKAADIILDRGLGKPRQEFEVIDDTQIIVKIPGWDDKDSDENGGES
jgi:hypothetical protein